MTPEVGRRSATALARGLDILCCFSKAQPEISGGELAAMTGLAQPTVWRLCHTMVQLGYLVVVGEKLRPGLPVLKLGRAALAGIPMAEVAHRLMQALADRLVSSSGLGMQDGGHMVLVQRCVSEATLGMNVRTGARLPLLSSAVGWGWLAGLEAPTRDALLARYGPAEPRWPELQPLFAAAMASAGRHGFILNIGVSRPGYNVVAVPLRGLDGVSAFGLTCAGCASTHPPELLSRRAAPMLLAMARTLERSHSAYHASTDVALFGSLGDSQIRGDAPRSGKYATP